MVVKANYLLKCVAQPLTSCNIPLTLTEILYWTTTAPHE